MGCNVYSGNTLRYQCSTSQPMPTRSGGVFGFLSSLLGGQRTIAYRQPAPEPATPTVAPGEPEPKRKAVTVIVALDSQALADAVREQLGDQALADE